MVGFSNHHFPTQRYVSPDVVRPGTLKIRGEIKAMFLYWIYTLFTDKHPLHFKVQTAKNSNSFNNLMRDVLPEVSLQIFPVNWLDRTFWSRSSSKRSPWTASVIHLGKNATPQPIDDSRGYFTCGWFHLFRPKTCRPKRVWRLNSCIIASKWRRNICWGPGPRFKGFHGGMKKAHR